MTKVRIFHLVRLLVISATGGCLLFWMGWIMGKEHYQHQIVKALKAGNNHEAISWLVEWQKRGGLESPVFFATKAIVHLKNGNADAAMHNLNKIIELTEKQP